MSPKVSVIIPAFNRAEFLQRAIFSVLNQSFIDYELLVIDDGSTEDLCGVEATLKDRGHQYFKIQNSGVAFARNKGIELAKGEWLCFLDSDDLWYPDKLLKQVEFHQQNFDILISQTLEDWYWENVYKNRPSKHIQPEGDIFEACCQICCISPSSVMLHKSLLKKLGNFDANFIVCEDFELWLRVAAQYKVGLVKKVLVRKDGGHSDQLSKSMPVLDLWRVKALSKSLLALHLNQQQTAIAKASLIAKLEVLKLGAQKRKLPTSRLYEDFSIALKQVNWKEGLKSFDEKLGFQN